MPLDLSIKVAFVTDVNCDLNIVLFDCANKL